MKYGPWKIWNGGECPVGEGVIGQIQRRDDTRLVVEAETPEPLVAFRWSHFGGYGDIIAYREVIEPERETRTRENWVKTDGMDGFYFCPAPTRRAQPVTITIDLEDGQIIGGTIKPRVAE